MTEQEYQHNLDNCLSARKAAYQQESDGLYFSAMLENTSLDDWKVKIQEIKNRYPKPEYIIDVEAPIVEPEAPITEEGV